MPFKVQVGPHQIAIHHGQTVLVSEPDGQINWPSEKGLYFFDTRVISSWTIYANGEPWELLNGGAITYYASRTYLTNRRVPTFGGIISPRTLGLVVSRLIGDGVHEDIEVTNNGMQRVHFQLEISLRCDFADIFEVKAGNIVRRGRIATTWSQSKQRLRTSYRNGDFVRAITIAPGHGQAQATYSNGRLSFEISLDPAEAWHCCLLYTLEDGERLFRPPHQCADQHQKTHHAERLSDWLRSVLKIRCSNEEFYRLYRQALEDMAALRLPIIGTDHKVFLPAAGLPWFVAPFGRDSLIVSLQNTLIYPDFARGSLDIMGSLQAKTKDDYRDAEPGKIPHEIRYGELAHFKLIPHTPYYGTADATPLYLITLHAAWRATGDTELLERHLKTAEECLSWIDNYGDRDGDGFQEYQTRSPVGYENMGWKDSGDSVVYPDGSLVKGPKALCELQGYVYDAWLRMSDIFEELGKLRRAEELRAKAATLFKRFNEAFWDEELGFYVLALDGEKKKVLTVASNAGHCLWSGIVPSERAEKVVKPDGAGHVERLGHPHALSPASSVQSIQLPDWIGLAARQRHHRTRIQTLWLRSRGSADRPRYQRRRRPLSVEPAARTLHHDRSRRKELPGPIPRRERTAGLGGWLGVRVAASNTGRRAGRAAGKALPRSVAAEVATGPHGVRPSCRQRPI
jgi:glycogen debranching enzyme